MTQGRDDLVCIECWIERGLLRSDRLAGSRRIHRSYEDGAQLEECICQLDPQSAHDVWNCWRVHTVANSTLFPSDAATRSPFFTPIPSSPLASALLLRSRAS